MPALSPLVAAAALTFPVLGEDFSTYVNTFGPGQIHTELFVGPDGEVDDCTVLYTDFRREIGEGLCNQLRQLSVEQPARDEHGEAIHGTAIYTFHTEFNRVFEQSVLWREPVLDLTVNRLPPDVEGQLLVGLRVLIDANGQIETCEANTRAEDPYTRSACAQVATLTHLVRHDRSGQPVRYLTDMNVVFTLG